MEENKQNKNTIMIFIAFTLISFSMHFFSDLMILKYTFKPFEVFFHEIGHGFASLLSGGTIDSLHLEYNQGHIVQSTKETYQPFVAFMGYVSASLFGYLIYISSLSLGKYLKIALVLLSAFWFIYVDGLMTAFILLSIMGTFAASWYLKEYGSYLIRFLGIYIMVSAIYSPTYLWAYSDSGDHIAMRDLTMIPSFVFIIIWFLIGLFFLYKAFKSSLKHKVIDKKECK